MQQKLALVTSFVTLSLTAYVIDNRLTVYFAKI